MRRFKLLTLALILIAARSAEAAPRLGVLVVFDQLPAWLLARADPFFGSGGFGGLDGAHYVASYPYASTETGPGHATLSTCSLPNVHGITGNSWFAERTRRYAVEDAAFPVLGASGTPPPGRSAVALLAPTLGDTLRIESSGRARVVAFSHKDRAAILSAGKSANLAVWYDPAQGRYTTSTAYADALPPWLAELGQTLPASAMRDGRWSPLPTPKGLAPLLPEDNRPGEGAMEGAGPTFPHDLTSAPEGRRRALYRLSPQSVTDLFALALRAVDEMKLGADAVPDLLVVSVSTTDVVGHNYGPESLEALDMLRRSDLALRDFVAQLKKRLGADALIVAVTSDHGAPTLPQTADAVSLPTPALTVPDVVDAANAAIRGVLAARPPSGDRTLGFFPPHLFLDLDGLGPSEQERVLVAVKKAIERLAGVAQVYRTDSPEQDGFTALMMAAAAPGRRGQLLVRTAPRVVVLSERTPRLGTDHGSAYLYDRRVPFLLSGPGVKAGKYASPVDPRDVAPSLAFLLGIAPPDLCEGRPVSAVGD